MNRPADPNLRQRILDAARDVFSRDGFEAVSLRQVAATAGCTAPAIYLHFEDRDELIQQLCLTDYLTLASALQTLARHRDPLRRIQGAAEAILDFGLAHPHSYRLLFLTPRPFATSEEGRRRNTPEQNAYLFVREALTKAQEVGELMSGDPDLFTQTFLAGIHGVIAIEVVGFQDTFIDWRPLKRRFRLMVETLLQGLRS